MVILGVRIDDVNMSQAIDRVASWVKQSGTKYIVTPNIEFIMAAQRDKEFGEILNNADMAVCDSARFGWAQSVLKEKNIFKKILQWPFFLFPRLLGDSKTVTGTDLMEQLLILAAEKGYSVGFLGGGKGIVEKLVVVLRKEYPSLKISYVSDGGTIDNGGNHVDVSCSKYDVLSRGAELQNTKYKIPDTDILFVAFGHIKQEKWIYKNLNKYPVKVMMGVGGAFDYLSGEVLRAPGFIRSLGFEWLFRLILQPWRIRRFGSLVGFVFSVLLSPRAE